MTTHPYQYGSNPDNVIYLTVEEANVVNNRSRPYPDCPQSNLRRIADALIYNRTVPKLNEFIADHGGSIECTNTWLNDHDLLTRI